MLCIRQVYTNICETPKLMNTKDLPMCQGLPVGLELSDLYVAGSSKGDVALLILVGWLHPSLVYALY